MRNARAALKTRQSITIIFVSILLFHAVRVEFKMEGVAYYGRIILVHFSASSGFRRFADIENVFFWASLRKTADFEKIEDSQTSKTYSFGKKRRFRKNRRLQNLLPQNLVGLADFAEIPDFVNKLPVGLL